MPYNNSEIYCDIAWATASYIIGNSTEFYNLIPVITQKP